MYERTCALKRCVRKKKERDEVTRREGRQYMKRKRKGKVCAREEMKGEPNEGAGKKRSRTSLKERNRTSLKEPRSAWPSFVGACCVRT